MFFLGITEGGAAAKVWETMIFTDKMPWGFNKWMIIQYILHNNTLNIMQPPNKKVYVYFITYCICIFYISFLNKMQNNFFEYTDIVVRSYKIDVFVAKLRDGNSLHCI